MNIFEMSLEVVLNWYVIGMFLFVATKGILAGIAEMEYSIEFWETIFYPLYVVYQAGKVIGIIFINIISFIINMFG
jgi:hypothetical protein